MGLICIDCSYLDLKAEDWEECPLCKNVNKDLFLRIKPDDLVLMNEKEETKE